MNQAHGKGKTVNLQHITVKVPGQHMPIAKTTSLPRSSALLPPVETLQHQSDRNNSISPMSSVDVNKQMSSDQPDTSSLIKVTPCSPPRQPRSPTASDDGSVDDLTTRSDKYPFSHRNMGHLRNNSMDEITLQLLKTSGAAFPAQSPLNADDQQRDRSFTLNRMQAKKGKLLKGTMLSPISYSEEELSEPSRSGSHENLKQEAKKNKKDNKNRNSLILGERSGSDSIPNKDEGKKDKKMAPKHRRNASQGFVKTMDVVDTPTEHQETTEFHIHSLEGKVWLFDAANMEEMNDWVKAVEGQIKKILEESLLPKRNSSNEEAKAKIIAMKGNDLCADCGSPNPEWASLNHGCLVCIDCSGVHRKLGSHISKIKGLHLDEWK
jgi:Arf-GAP/GTPase/ANK repeat/PH domain-containing protein 1/3